MYQAYKNSVMSNSTFSGKSVIVTGSSSGIGESTALMFATRGANVTICGRDAARVQEVVGKCEKAGKDAGHKTKALGVTGEMTKAECRTETIKKTVEAFGGLDVLVANHGMSVQTMNLDAVTEEVFDQQFDVNVKSVLFLIQEAVPHLEKSKGCIVATSSLASTTATNGLSICYYVSKAAIDHMVRCLALELGPKGIRINVVNPTFIETRLGRGGEANPLVAELFKFTAASHPLGQRNGETEEQAEAICFLCSDGARFITGECLKVDGGLSLKGNPVAFFFQNMMAQQQAS